MYLDSVYGIEGLSQFKKIGGSSDFLKQVVVHIQTSRRTYSEPCPLPIPFIGVYDDQKNLKPWVVCICM